MRQKIGPTRQSKANFSVSYEGGWKVEHTLEKVTYGTGEYGSWMLLQGEVTSAPALVAYAKTQNSNKCTHCFGKVLKWRTHISTTIGIPF